MRRKTLSCASWRDLNRKFPKDIIVLCRMASRLFSSFARCISRRLEWNEKIESRGKNSNSNFLTVHSYKKITVWLRKPRICQSFPLGFTFLSLVCADCTFKIRNTWCLLLVFNERNFDPSSEFTTVLSLVTQSKTRSLNRASYIWNKRAMRAQNIRGQPFNVEATSVAYYYFILKVF